MSDLTVMGIAFAFIGLVALFPILKPEAAARLTARYFAWSMKLWGFEGDVRVTPRAVKLCRAWNLCLLGLIGVIVLVMALASR